MIHVDLENGRVFADGADGDGDWSLASAEGFALVARAWLRAGWDAKYVYSFTWMGRPVIQLPDDLLRIQEVICAVMPDVIIETGVAHGGSLVFYATLCKALDKGRVIGVDIEIRPANRGAIEAHRLFSLITLIEGNSVAPDIVSRVRGGVREGESVLVILDSSHTRDHVAAELEAYAPLVTPGSYVVITDGIMSWLGGAPRTKPDWPWNNPLAAASTFLARHPEFVVEEPLWPFNEGSVKERVTYWPNAFLRKIR